MPRQSSNNSSNYRSTGTRTTRPRTLDSYTATPTIYDRKISSTQPQTSHQPVEHQAPGILSSMKQGIGFGMGSEIGHRVINSFWGPSYEQTKHVPSENEQLYVKCLEKNEGFPEICKPFQTKDKSPWKLCMETADFNHLKCTE